MGGDQKKEENGFSVSGFLDSEIGSLVRSASAFDLGAAIRPFIVGAREATQAAAESARVRRTTSSHSLSFQPNLVRPSTRPASLPCQPLSLASR